MGTCSNRAWWAWQSRIRERPWRRDLSLLRALGGDSLGSSATSQSDQTPSRRGTTRSSWTPSGELWRRQRWSCFLNRLRSRCTAALTAPHQRRNRSVGARSLARGISCVLRSDGAATTTRGRNRCRGLFRGFATVQYRDGPPEEFSLPSDPSRRAIPRPSDYRHWAWWRKAWSTRTRAVIDSTIGTARGRTQGS